MFNIFFHSDFFPMFFCLIFSLIAHFFFNLDYLPTLFGSYIVVEIWHSEYIRKKHD